MAASDQPRIEKLNAKNYPLWKFAMRTFIEGKGWNDLVTDGIPEPEEGAEPDANNVQKDAQCRSAIVSSIDNEHLAMVIHCNTAKEMWDAIVGVREQASDQNKMLLQFQFMEYKFKPGRSMSEFVSGLNLLATQLKGLGKEIDDTEFITKIMHELPKEYDNFRTNFRLLASENADILTREKFTGHLLAAE